VAASTHIVWFEADKLVYSQDLSVVVSSTLGLLLGAHSTYGQPHYGHLGVVVCIRFLAARDFDYGAPHLGSPALLVRLLA
jgi:hypothetical protein